jgi:O-antigen ligase
MNPSEPILLRAARWLAFASAVSVLFSIAVCQILLALSIAALLVSGAPLRFPPIKLPLGLFLLGTLISLAFSDEPSAGLPQIRKMYVFLMLLVVYSTVRELALIRRLFLAWAGVGALIALRGYVQFGAKLQEAHALGRSFYEYYVAERITGFMSHWMTFSGQEMFALLMLVAFLLYGCGKRKWPWVACGGLIGLALVLGWTRSIWGASAAGILYLAWFWRRWVAVAVPIVGLAAVMISPPEIKERFTSILKPRKDTDSNEHRVVTRRTGINIIKHHPLLGLGPEGVKLHFKEYVPDDIARPLPPGWYGHLHNIYLHYAAERGIPTMLMLMWLLGQVLWDFWRGLRAAPPGRSDVLFILHGGVAVLLATLVAGFYELNLGDSEVLTMFLVVVACGYAAIDANRAAKEESTLG